MLLSFDYNWVAEILHTDVKGIKAKGRGTESRTLQDEFVSVPVPPDTVTYLLEASLMYIKELP